MARIRSVKPDFWADEKIGALSPLARLAFIGSWNYADDEGLLRWTPEYLTASVFMYDGLSTKKVQQVMLELAEADLVFPYAIGRARQQLAYVVNFRVHQKINRPQPSKLEPPSIDSDRTRSMYAKRDRWACHLCLGPINRERLYAEQRYDDDNASLKGYVELNLSIDHLVPRISGGTDHPSNLKCAHLSCNKARRDMSIDQFTTPESVRRALLVSVNTHGRITEGSPPEGEGSREGKGGGGEQADALPPPPRCAQHVDNPSPGPCGPCKDSRLARKAWDALAGEREREAVLTRRKCPHCDADGYRYEPGTRVPKAPYERCNHLRSVS